MKMVRKALGACLAIVVLCLAMSWVVPAAAMAGDGGEPDVAAGTAESGEEVYVVLRIPLAEERCADTPVALVNDEPITLRELTGQLASMHAGLAPETTSAGTNYTGMLERIIATRLILLEAENIGLQERYGIQEQIDGFVENLLLDQVMASHVKDVQANDADVDALYRKMARAVKLDVLRLTDGAAAKKFDEEIAAGREFPEIATALVEAGQAQLEGGDDFLKLKDLRQQIAAAVINMPTGSVSPVFQDESGLFALRLNDAHFEEDASVKEEARRIVREQAKREEARRYGDLLRKKHARVDERLLESLDFEVERTGLFGLGEARPVDYQKLLADRRVLATVLGPEPVTITVGDLARAVEEKLYHGADKAAASGKLNDRKDTVFKNMLFKLVARREASDQGIDQSEAFITEVDEYKRSLLFGAFVRKVVAPEVTLPEEEVRAYYETHLGDYSSPAMVKMNSLAFKDKASAEDAAAKLKKRTDFGWVSANVPGQVDKDAEGILVFDGRLLTVSSLPDGFREVVGGAKDGDVLSHDTADGVHYVLVVNKMIAGGPQAYETVREEISKVVYGERLKAAVDGWVEKLKEAYDTKIFVTDFGL